MSRDVCVGAFRSKAGDQIVILEDVCLKEL
jgi:hypothetical protein